jgi:hypothetical protein
VRVAGSFTTMVTVNADELDEPEATPRRACRVTFQATFGEEAANFDWLERGITSVQGVLIDRSVEDHGRKAPGSIWTLNAALDLLP